MRTGTARQWWSNHRLIVGLLSALSAAVSFPACAEPTGQHSAINNWSDLRTAIAACWSVPPDTKGSLIAFRFGIDKAGALRGPPLVTARRLEGDREARKRYEDGAREALSRCFPIGVTPAFGAILGESPVRLRLVNTPPEAAYQLNSNITIFAPQ